MTPVEEILRCLDIPRTKICAVLANRCASDSEVASVLPPDRSSYCFKTRKITSPMNVGKQTLKFIGLGSLLTLALGITSSTLRAGAVLPPDWHRNTTVASADDANAVKPSNTIVMACSACKTVAITERRVVPGAKAGTALFNIGSKHECTMCGGAITTVNGQTTGTMQGNCKLCASVAAPCCAPSAGVEKS